MIVRNNPTFYGALLAIVFLALFQRNVVLGQAETVTEEDDSTDFSVFNQDTVVEDTAQSGEDACPCILKSRCPRVYGSNPLDLSEIGHVEPCKEEGYVRCCGVSVSIVQAADEVHYDETVVSVEFGDSDNQDVPTSTEEAAGKDHTESENNDELAEEDNLHASEGREEVEKGNSDEVVVTETELHETDESNKDHNEDKETDDLIPAESNQGSYTVIVEPPAGDSPKPRRKFQPKFPRYGRPGKSFASSEGSEDGSNSGINGPNEKTLSSEESNKENVEGENNNPSSGNGGSGSVVYSQRVTNFSPYRRRNNVNTAPVFTITPSDSPNDSETSSRESDNAEAVTTNRRDRPKYQMRRRKPFNQMRNRPQQEEQETTTTTVQGNEDDGIETNDKKQPEIYGASSSPNQGNPASLHVSEPDALPPSAPSSEGTQDELDNQKRPMSRLVKPRVNALNRRRPGNRFGGSATTFEAEQDESLQSNNSYGSAPTLDNGKNDESKKTESEQEVLETGLTSEDNNNKATIGSEHEYSSVTSSTSAKLENSPTGKLTPFRPKIRPLVLPNRSPVYSVDTSADASVNQDDGQESSSSPPNSYDPIQSTDLTQPKTSGVNIRKIPMRRVKPNPEAATENEGDGNATEDVNGSSAPIAANPPRGKIIMRRPINSASSSSLHMKNAQEITLSTSPMEQEEDQDEKIGDVPQTPAPPKMETLDIRRKLLGRNRPNPLRTSSSLSSISQEAQETEKVENPVESSSSAPPQIESSRPNILKRRRRPLRKPLGSEQGQDVNPTNGPSEIDGVPAEGSDSSAEVAGEEQSVVKSPVRIRKGPRLPHLRKSQQEQQKEDSPAAEENNDSSESSSTVEESPRPSPLLRQRNRLNGNQRGRVRNPLLSSSTEAAPVDQSHTSETPVTVTSTYSRIRTNNKNGLLTRPAYRKPVKPSPAPIAEVEKDVPPVENDSTASSQPGSYNSNRVSKYRTRTRIHVPTTTAPLETSESVSTPITDEKAEGSIDESEKQGQSSQLNESLEENSPTQAPKRRRFGQRKRVKIVKVQKQEQEDVQESEQQQQHPDNINNNKEETKQKEEEVVVAGPTQEDKEQNAHPEGDNGIVINPTKENSEHDTSSEETVTSHYSNTSEMETGGEEVKQSEDQSPSTGNYPSSLDEIHLNEGKIVAEEENTDLMEHSGPGGANKYVVGDDEITPGNSNIGHGGLKTVAAPVKYDDAEDKKVSGYYHESFAGEGEEPYDLILNQDVRKQLGTQGTHGGKPHAFTAPSYPYQSYAQNEGHGYGPPAYHHRNHQPTLSHPTYLLNQDEHQEDYNYDPYNYDQYGHNEIHAANDGINKHSAAAGVVGTHEDNGHNAYAPHQAYYSHHYSGVDSMGGFETIEFGTPDYDHDPYNSWYAYGEQDEEESRISMKFMKDKINQSKSSQLSESSKERPTKGNGDSSSNINNDNEDKSISGGKVGPSRATQKTVNHLNAPSNEENVSVQTPHSLSKVNNNNNNNDNSNIRKEEGSLRIRQKLRRPPSLYINNSADSSERAAVPSTTAPFTPSIQSPKPTYSGQEALLESVTQSVQSLPTSENPSTYSDSKSFTYPNSHQLEQFIQNKQKPHAPGGARNRTRTRVKLVTMRTTTPAPVSQVTNDDVNATPDAPSSPLHSRSTQRPQLSSYSAFTFPPYKKSELTLISTTETPLENDAGSRSTSTPFLRKPFRNSYSSNSASSAASPELPKTSAQLTGNDRPKTNIVKSGANGRFKVPEKSSDGAAATSAQNTQSSTASPLYNHDVRTTRRPRPSFIRKFSSIRTTETPIHHQFPATSEAPQTYSTSENEIEEDVAISTPQTIPSTFPPPTLESYQESRPLSVPSEPERSPETVSIRIESTPSAEYHEINNNNVPEKPSHLSSENPVEVNSPSFNAIQYPSTQSFSKSSGNQGYSTTQDIKSASQKGKYSRFRVPGKFNLPSTSGTQTEENDLYPSNDHDNLKAPAHQDYDNFKVTVQTEPTTVSNVPLPTVEPETIKFDTEPYAPINTQYNRPPSGEFVSNFELPQQRPNFAEEQRLNEPEVVPDIRINVVQPPVLYSNENEERTTPRPLFHATREPEHVFQAPAHYPERNLFNPALRQSPYGPFPSTDHWSGIPSANSPKLPEHFEQKQVLSPPPPQTHSSNVIFEQNRRPGPLSHAPVLVPRPHDRPIRFEEDLQTNEFNFKPPPPVQETSIKFGTDFDESYDGEEREENVSPALPSRPPINNNNNNNNFKFPGPQREPPHFNDDREVQIQGHPVSHQSSPAPAAPLVFQNRPIQNPIEMPPASPPVSVQFQNHNGMEVQSRPLPSHETNQHFIKTQLPSREQFHLNAPQTPPVPVRTVMYEISNDELKTPHYEIPNVNEASKPTSHVPPLRLPLQQQQEHRLPAPQQNNNLHFSDLPVNNQLRPQQVHQGITHFPSKEPSKEQNNLSLDGGIDLPQRPNNVHLPNPNFIVQVNGIPHDAAPGNPGNNNTPKPVKRPGGHVFFEKEPQIKVPSQNDHPPPPAFSNDNKYQALKFENNQGPNTREPIAKPVRFPQQPQFKFPDSNLHGFGERPPSRPGQFGPPPPSQQSLPQYVPFGADRLKMNETGRPMMPPNNRPPIMSPPIFANPIKFGGSQPPIMPYNARPQQPLRQHGFMGPQIQSFPPNHRPQATGPSPHMMMPAPYPQGQYGGNQFFQHRIRNPNGRTSRAANFTAEEEKALLNEKGAVSAAVDANDEQEILFQQVPEKTPTKEEAFEGGQIQVEGEKASSQSAPAFVSEDVSPSTESFDQLSSSEKKNEDSLTTMKKAQDMEDSSSSRRQQRELNFDDTPRFQEDSTEQRDVPALVPEDPDNRDDEGTVKRENLVQDQHLDEIVESRDKLAFSTVHPFHSIKHSPDSNQPENFGEESSKDPLKLSKAKKFGEHKGKQESSFEKEENEKFSSISSTTMSNENKRGLMKAKNVNMREKSEQNSGKLKEKGKVGKEQMKEDENEEVLMSSINPAVEIQEQQEFVAPTVIQRGFHPILPYSEKDPGPILVQMMPKVEKFLPPQTTITHESNKDIVGIGSPFQILPPQKTNNQPITFVLASPPTSSSSIFPPNHGLDSKALLNGKQINSNNHLAVLQTNTLANNQTPFKALTSNHLTSGST